jgi:hypothetical protein
VSFRACCQAAGGLISGAEAPCVARGQPRCRTRSAGFAQMRAPRFRSAAHPLWTTTRHLGVHSPELLLCQAGHGNCGIQVNPCPLVGVRRGHQEEAVDVAREVALEAA